MNTAAETAHRLLQINAIKLSPQKPFTWASGRRSPIYCDNRIALSHPEVRRMVVNHLVTLAADFSPFDAVAGVATAGIPWGALVADQLDLPFVYVRSKAKEHGRQNQIEGQLQPGGRYLVIEDLISTGGSSLAAVEALRQAGAIVSSVLAVFTYGFEEAEEAFRQAECPCATLSNYTALLEAARQQQYIQENELATLQAWRKDPQQWSEASGVSRNN